MNYIFPLYTNFFIQDERWLDGEAVNLKNFVSNPGENSKPGSCAFIDDEFGGKWDYWDCNDPTRSICQSRKSNIPNFSFR